MMTMMIQLIYLAVTVLMRCIAQRIDNKYALHSVFVEKGSNLKINISSKIYRADVCKKSDWNAFLYCFSTSYPGEFGFAVTLEKQQKQTKSANWIVSQPLL